MKVEEKKYVEKEWRKIMFCDGSALGQVGPTEQLCGLLTNMDYSLANF